MNPTSERKSYIIPWPYLIVGFAIFIYGHSLANGFVGDDFFTPA
jgi:hypothetical protein